MPASGNVCKSGSRVRGKKKRKNRMSIMRVCESLLRTVRAIRGRAGYQRARAGFFSQGSVTMKKKTQMKLGEHKIIIS